MVLTKPTFFAYNNSEKKAMLRRTQHTSLFEKRSLCVIFLIGSEYSRGHTTSVPIPGRIFENHGLPDREPRGNLNPKITERLPAVQNNSKKPIRITTLTGLISLLHT
jgi:hypothetical protein